MADKERWNIGVKDVLTQLLTVATLFLNCVHRAMQNQQHCRL